MVGWKKILLEELAGAKNGLTKSQAFIILSKRRNLRKDTVYNSIDEMLSEGLLSKIVSPESRRVIYKLKKKRENRNVKKIDTKKQTKKIVKKKPVKKLGKAKTPTTLKRHVKKPPKKVRPAKSRPKVKPANVAIVFGNHIPLKSVKDAAQDAKRWRSYTIDEIHIKDYIPGEDPDNVIVKINILDRIEEQLRTLYPKAVVTRTNKITIEVK